MSKKALVYANINCSEKSYIKKIENICKTFNTHDFKTKLLIKKDLSKNFCTYEDTIMSKNTILSYFNFLFLVTLSKFNLIYIRHPRLNFAYIFLLFFTKLFNKNSFIIHEIPTYPYDHEWDNNKIIEIIKCKIDKFCRLFLKYFIDLIVAIGGHKGDKIFGIRAIEIINGIDVNDYKPYKKLNYKKNINLIGVGNISLRHGYDRIIKAISKMDKPHLEVNFYIIGSGPEINNLKKLSKNLKLYDNNIFFCGERSGQSLEEFFSKSHLAIGNLGFHRIGVNKSSSLKEREYMARGIPFISVDIDNRIDRSKSCIYQVEASEKDIPLEIILEQFKTKYNDNYFKYLRNFTKKNLNWNKTLTPLLNEIKKIL